MIGRQRGSENDTNFWFSIPMTIGNNIFYSKFYSPENYISIKSITNLFASVASSLNEAH